MIFELRATARGKSHLRRRARIACGSEQKSIPTITGGHTKGIPSGMNGMGKTDPIARQIAPKHRPSG